MLRFPWNRGLPRPLMIVLLIVLMMCGLLPQRVTADAASAPDAVDETASSSPQAPPAKASPDAPVAPTQDGALTQDGELTRDIDRLIERDAVGPLSTVCSDAEFVRRVWLDLAGQLPPHTRVREFLADTQPQKRSQLVDELLSGDAFVRHLAQLLDVMLLERRTDKAVPEPDWERYLVTSVVENQPLDGLYRDFLAAPVSEDSGDPAAAAEKWVASRFLLNRDAEPHAATRDVGRMVFGVDLQCAQCHDHPLIDDYYQADYYGLYGFLQRTGQYTDAKTKQVRLSEKADGSTSFQSVFTGEGREQFLPRLPKGARVWTEPTFAKGEEYLVAPEKNVPGIPKYSRRAVLAEMLGENRLFRRNLANRLWSMVMGRGLVHPLDHHHAGNPPSHPELLTRLADELVRTNFDSRQLLRQIVNSRTYQRSCQPPAPETINAADLVARIESLQTRRTALEAGLTDVTTAANDARKELDEAIAAGVQLDLQIAELQKPLTEAQQQTSQARKTLQEGQAVAELRQRQLRALQDAFSTLEGRPDESKPADETVRADRDGSVSGEGKRTAENQAADLLEPARAVLVRHQQLAAEAFQQAEEKVQELQAALSAAEHTEQQAVQAIVQAESTRISVAQLKQLEDARLTTADALSDYRFRIHQVSELSALAESLLNSTRLFQTDAAAAEQGWPGLVTRLTINCQTAPLKPLTPEQLTASMQEATGVLSSQIAAVEGALQKKPPAVPENATEADKAKLHRVALNTGMINRLRSPAGQFVKWYGGLPGEDFQATAAQALFFGNGQVIDSWIKPAGDNLMARLKLLEDPDDITDELYIAIFCRPASAEEQREIRSLLIESADERDQVLSEVIWAMLSSTEFRFNH